MIRRFLKPSTFCAPSRFRFVTKIENIRNIGISAHIDSGKTTFTERVLFYTGKIQAIHEVKGSDKVGATMDHMELERERGITIQSAATYCKWADTDINIIDTPGHVDFTIEVERAMRVLDGAVMILCGSSGVQSQTLTVNKQMTRYDVPRVIFINKLDRAGANPWTAVEQLRKRLGLNVAAVNIPIGIETTLKGVVDLITQEAVYFDGDNGEVLRREPVPESMKEIVADKRNELISSLADIDDELAEKFLMEEPISEEEIEAAIKKGVKELTFFPILMGSAIKNKGVQLVLSAVEKYLPHPGEKANKAITTKEEKEVQLEPVTNKPFVALAFKLEENQFGQLTYLRVYQGKLKKGETIDYVAKGKKVKISRMVKMHSDKMEDISEVGPGDIFGLFGIECSTGDTFTKGLDLSMENMHVPESVISLAISPKKKDQIDDFMKAINRFKREDPTFKVSMNRETDEMLISGMGELHLQIYAERIKREYGVDIEVGNPKVNYKETISQEASFDYLHKKQSGGAGQFARVIGRVKPMIDDFHDLSDVGNQFVDATDGHNIPNEYRTAIEKAFHEGCVKGPLTGSQVLGVQYVLEDGVTHVVDSSSLAFSIATKYSMRQAFKKAGPVILEPIMTVEVSGPTEYQSAMMDTLSRRKGHLVDTETTGESFVVRSEVALSNMFGYASELRGVTQGLVCS